MASVPGPRKNKMLLHSRIRPKGIGHTGYKPLHQRSLPLSPVRARFHLGQHRLAPHLIDRGNGIFEIRIELIGLLLIDKEVEDALAIVELGERAPVPSVAAGLCESVEEGGEAEPQDNAQDGEEQDGARESGRDRSRVEQHRWFGVAGIGVGLGVAADECVDEAAALAAEGVQCGGGEALWLREKVFAFVQYERAVVVAVAAGVLVGVDAAVRLAEAVEVWMEGGPIGRVESAQASVGAIGAVLSCVRLPCGRGRC